MKALTRNHRKDIGQRIKWRQSYLASEDLGLYFALSAGAKEPLKLMTRRGAIQRIYNRLERVKRILMAA